MGKLLVQVEPATGKTKRDGTVPLSREKAAADAGIKERQRETAIRIAKIPKADFEQMVESEKAPKPYPA